MSLTSWAVRPYPIPAGCDEREGEREGGRHDRAAKLDLEGSFNGIAIQIGLAEKFYWDYAGEVPLLTGIAAAAFDTKVDKPLTGSAAARRVGNYAGSARRWGETVAAAAVAASHRI